jgi:gliding motility-associated-like protein
MEDTFEVKVIAEPARPVEEMYVICKNRNSTFITVNPPSATQVLWSTGARGRILEVDTPGNYWVNLKNRCYDSTWQFRVREEIPGYTLLIPNAFSPNGDALNETFQISGLEELESYRCEIYNRWGEMVFASSDKKHFWDGTINGKPAPKGVYIYLIRGKSICTQVKLFKGVFHLL